MTTTLYLTRNGLLEPLGQSQVLPYLRGLARDYRIILITREKDEDWADARALAEMRAECEALGIVWRPRLFRPRPRYLGPVWDILSMVLEARRATLRERVRLVHARSYIPAAVAWAVWRSTGTSFIFDMRALWPEELIVAGRLRRNSVVHRVLKHFESVCLRDAAAVVSLTDAAVDYLRDIHPEEMAPQRIQVIPTCADLERFRPGDEPSQERVYGCVGTVLSGWFRLDWLSAFFRAVTRHDPGARLEVVTRDDAKTVRNRLDPGCEVSNLSVFPLPSERMPEAIRRHNASVMFFTEGISKIGSAPTRLGEVLGCGIPVVVNDCVGDVARIVRRYHVGVIIDGGSDAAMNKGVGELARLRADPDLPARCRRAAEEVFSLERGTEAYRKLYADILGDRHPSKANDERDGAVHQV